MTDYTKLVAALRGMDTGDSCPCEYYMMCEDSDCVLVQAADAIEALQEHLAASNDEVNHLAESNKELQAELNEQLPKRGEIVRCGECKWYGIYYVKKDGTPDKRYSPSVCLRGIYAKRRDPDWFCADGEREVQE